jgi:hypothetical protein
LGKLNHRLAELEEVVSSNAPLPAATTDELPPSAAARKAETTEQA